jgi:hypothetical protein
MSSFPPPHDPSQQGPRVVRSASPQPGAPAQPPTAPYAPPPTPPSQPLYAPPGPAAYAAPTLPPLAPLPPVRYRKAGGSAVAAVFGGMAVLSFFGLPYINLGIFGSLTGAQVTNTISNLYSLSTAFSQSSQFSTNGAATPSGPGIDPSLFLWLEMLSLAVAASVGAWQWFRARNGGPSPSNGAAVVVLICGLIGAAILLLQLIGLQSSETGRLIASALGIGFWLMLLSAIAVVGGAIAQLRA